MKSIFKLLVYVLPAIIFLVSCQKELVCPDCPGVQPPNNNQPLVAKAGADQVIVLPTSSTTLDGSASTGNVLTYRWVKLGGPLSYNIVTANSAKTLVENLISAAYSFELTVSDGVGQSAKDTVNVIVGIP